MLWKAERPAIRHRYAWLTPTLVVNDGVVLSADRLADQPVDTGGEDQTAIEWRVSANHILTDGQFMAFSADDGKPLWTAPCHEGFNSPVDVFVIDGRVYTRHLGLGKAAGDHEGLRPAYGRGRGHAQARPGKLHARLRPSPLPSQQGHDRST